MHSPQRVHRSVSIVCFSYGAKGMASAGQHRAHLVQPMQSSVTVNVTICLQLPVRQIPCTCSSYSLRKCRRVDRTGLGAVLPNPQSAAFFTAFANTSRLSMSFIVPLPDARRSRMSSILLAPTLQNVHLPQLSPEMKLRK